MKTVQMTLDENLITAVDTPQGSWGRRDADCAVNLDHLQTVSKENWSAVLKLKGKD
jgi:hypothetical protein